MIHMRDASPMAGHHGAGAVDLEGDEIDDEDERQPPIVETVAKTGEGVEGFLEVLSEHAEWLEETGELEAQARQRYAAEIRTLLREDSAALVEEELQGRGGLDAYVEAVTAKETDPYSVADEIVGPVADCVRESREE